MADTWRVCRSPIVSAAAEAVSLSPSFGVRCVQLSQAGPLQAATVNTSSLSSSSPSSSSPGSTPACTLPGPPSQAPLTLTTAVSYLLQSEVPRRYFSQLASPPNVDWSQGGTAVTMIGFNYPSISLMHCSGEPVGGCFYVPSGGGRLLNFFCSFLSGVFSGCQFYCVTWWAPTLSSIKACALKFTLFFAWSRPLKTRGLSPLLKRT